MVQMLLLGLVAITKVGHGAITYQTLPSSCISLSDGEHYVQPLSTDELQKQAGDDTIVAHPMRVTCDNGYMIIDPSKDKNVQSYFSSFHSYHSAFGGPDLDDHVTWKEWFLPSRYDSSINVDNEDDYGIIGSHLTISPDCQTCTTPDETNYPYETTYYMTGDVFGCTWSDGNTCEYDVDTFECHTCANTINDDSEELSSWGSCGHLEASATHSVQDNHNECAANGYTMMPSIGTSSTTTTDESNQFCVCYRPSGRVSTYFDTSADDFDISSEISQDLADIDSLFDNDATRMVHIGQNDFQHGTYRITRSGKYTLTEDIILDFNAASNEDLLLENEDYSINGDESAFFPRSTQINGYPGASELDGWYWLGFYAGISIEADNVVLDLNGYTISMSYAFYLQQRWFTTILVGNKPFIDGQGPTLLGAGFSSPKSTLIKNGIVGLSSHHGILALSAVDCVIEDIQIRDFETHGLAANEFKNLRLSNIEIGPSSRYVYLNGLYNLARMQLPILRDVVDEYGDKTVAFSGRGNADGQTFSDLYDRLITQMDFAFNYVYNSKSIDKKDEDYDEFSEAIKLFVNPTGISPHGVVYGAVFRPRGASMENFGSLMSGSSRSSNLIVNDLEIHDLAVDVKEYFGMQDNTQRLIRDPINGVFPIAEAATGFGNDLNDLTYNGNVYTDIVIGLKSVTNSWWHLGRMSMSDEIVQWALSGDKLSNFYEAEVGEEETQRQRYCNMDALGNLVKGMLGIRMEWINNVKVNNLNIHDLFSLSDLGNSDYCGDYVSNGHPSQNDETNPGYGGINTYGMMLYELEGAVFDTLTMSNLVSYNGPTTGVKQFYSNANTNKKSNPQVTLKNVEMSNFLAGTELTGNDGKESNWPNAAASVCGFAEDDQYYATIVNPFADSDDEETEPQLSCLSGKALCGECDSESCFGEYSECTKVITVETPYHTIKAILNKIRKEETHIDELSLDSDSTPSLLSKIMSEEPERIEIVINVENELTDEETDSIVEEAILAKSITASKRQLNVDFGVISLSDKQAIWIGISLFLITISLIVLYTYTKCEMGHLKFKNMNLANRWKSLYGGHDGYVEV